MYRIVTSPRYSVTAPEIMATWSMEDLVDANLVEDMFDELDRKAAAASRRAGAV